MNNKPAETLFYEDYKQPLKKIRKGQGFGYYGTIAMSLDKTLIQCHICGNLYARLHGHLKQHDTTAPEYKQKFGLSLTTTLESEASREKRQLLAVQRPEKRGLPIWLAEYTDRVRAGLVAHSNGKKGGKDYYSLEWRNKRGLCPEQVLEKIKDLEAKLGRVPSYDEFREEYKGRYTHAIKTLHGSWSNAVRKLYKVTREDLRHPDSGMLLRELRDFSVLHKRIPMTSDFNRGLLRDKNVYIRKFGTLNNARIEAGLNAVLPMPFGQIVELTPEQYAEYKQGKGLSKAALKSRQWRARKKQIAGVSS